MKRSGGATWILLVLAKLAFAADATHSHSKIDSTSVPRESWDRYRVLVERNIFRRDRMRPPAPRPEISRPSVGPERTVVLAGIVRQDDGYIAFFEDRRTGTVTRARSGDTFLWGRIEQVTLDYVLYVCNDKTIKIEVGHSLEGAPPEPVTAASATVPGTAAAPAPASRPATEPVGRDERAILERLRQRRAQEMGSK